MRGFENVLMDVVAYFDFYEEFLDRLVEHQMEILQRLLVIPIDGIWLFGDWRFQQGVLVGADPGENCYQRGGYILGPAKGIQPETPDEYIAMLWKLTSSNQTKNFLIILKGILTGCAMNMIVRHNDLCSPKLLRFNKLWLTCILWCHKIQIKFYNHNFGMYFDMKPTIMVGAKKIG